MATILCPDCSHPVSVHDAICTTCGRLTPRVTPHHPEAAPTTDLAVPNLTVPRSTTAFPLTLSFKTLALAPQLSVTDGRDQLLLYVRQKFLKLKEHVTVFADQEQTRPLYTLRADRAIDFSAQYTFYDAQGAEYGAIRRKGMRSLWKAHYEIVHRGRVVMAIHEENPWIKLADGVLRGIPIVGLFRGYLFHPSFRVTRADGRVILRMTKQAAFLEGRFGVERLMELTGTEEGLGLLGLLMVVLLERRRG